MYLSQREVCVERKCTALFTGHIQILPKLEAAGAGAEYNLYTAGEEQKIIESLGKYVKAGMGSSSQLIPREHVFNKTQQPPLHSCQIKKGTLSMLT